MHILLIPLIFLYLFTGGINLSLGEIIERDGFEAIVKQDNKKGSVEEDAKDIKKKISLDLKGVEIVELLRILSLKTGLTVVPSKHISGRINIYLNDLTFKDALDVVLISQDLACEKKGNILYVMTASEYEKLYGKKYNEKREFKTLNLKYAKPSSVFNALSKIKSNIGKVIVDEATGTLLLIDIPEKLELMSSVIQQLDQPLETEIFELEYADSEEVESHLSSVITSGPGEVFADKRTKKIVVSDLPEKMNKIKKMLQAFDEQSRQVFIEAEILQIVLKKEFQKGINWEQVFSQNWLHNLNFKGTFPVTPSFSPSSTLSTANIELSIGTVAEDNYTAMLQFLETFGDTKILSRPKIAVVNNEEANVMVGTREAYTNVSRSQGQSTTVTSENIEFIDVGVKLNVTPTINKEGFVTMKIKPEVSSAREVITTDLGSRIPIVETSEAETVVKVKSGVMIMIAGLMKEEKRDDIVGIPILSKIPFLGTFFTSKANLKQKTELIVFLRPRIISGEAALAGTEPEKIIPPAVLPTEMRKKIISEAVENIKAIPSRRRSNDVIDIFKKKKSNKKENRIKGEIKPIKLQEKLKGFKKY